MIQNPHSTKSEHQSCQTPLEEKRENHENTWKQA